MSTFSLTSIPFFSSHFSRSLFVKSPKITRKTNFQNEFRIAIPLPNTRQIILTHKKSAVTIKVTALFHHNIYILLSSQRSGRSRAHIRVRPSHSPVMHTRVVRICRERVILRFWYFALCAKNQLSERQRVLIFGAWF